jgi:Response regulator containing CheY-like receiver domain and AraC-type DNA-binding domain
MVDDEIFSIQGILDSVNWTKVKFDKVLTANSFSQAMNIFLQDKIDILLCDIEMPFGNGIQLVEWVKERYPQVECIFLTCHGEFSFASSAIKLRCFDYILKPVPTDILEDTLLRAQKKIEQERLEQNYLEYGKMYINQMKEENSEKLSKDVAYKVKAYINEHIAEAVNVEMLARLVNLSPDYLTRIFKKEEQITLNDYIIQQRMFLAKELLTTTEMSVNRVSDKSGYSNYSYFSKAFKKYYGISPREMQQKNKKV